MVCRAKDCRCPRFLTASNVFNRLNLNYLIKDNIIIFHSIKIVLYAPLLFGVGDGPKDPTQTAVSDKSKDFKCKVTMIIQPDIYI